jgi:hypothetical protein
MVLQHEIGLKYLIFDGLGTLGIKCIVVAFTCLRSRPREKKDRLALIVSRPTILQDFLKKPTLKPSRPGALLSFREKRVFLISSSVIGESQYICFEDEIIGRAPESIEESRTISELEPSKIF